MKTQLAHKLSIQDIPLFQGLSSDELKEVKKCLHEKSFKKGDLLFLSGESCDRIFFIRSGQVKMFRTALSGREQVLEVLSPSDTCACNPGQSSWFCSSSAQALTDCDVWFFSRDKYTHLVNNNSRFSNTLNRLFAKRLCHLSSLVEEVSLKDVKMRLVKFLVDMNDNSVSQKGEENLIHIPFSREDIAQRIGTARETVTRYLQQLKRAKLIDIKPHQIIIRNKAGLVKMMTN